MMNLTYFENATREEGLARGYCARGIFATDIRMATDGVTMLVDRADGPDGVAVETVAVPCDNLVNIRTIRR